METQTPAPTRSAKEQFDQQAAHYDAQWNTWSEETLRWLLDARRLPARRIDVLDVATGTGFTAWPLRRTSIPSIGLDVSPGMLAQARQQARGAGIDQRDVSGRRGGSAAVRGRRRLTS